MFAMNALYIYQTAYPLDTYFFIMVLIGLVVGAIIGFIIGMAYYPRSPRGKHQGQKLVFKRNGLTQRVLGAANLSLQMIISVLFVRLTLEGKVHNHLQAPINFFWQKFFLFIFLKARKILNLHSIE